jgi:carboxylesterase
MEKSAAHKNFTFLPDVSPKAQPFVIHSENSDTLAILIHGFSSSPYTFHDLAEYLAERGIDSETVLLAGHGRDFKSLQKSTALDWYQSAEKVLHKNQAKYKNIFVIGESFGSNVSIHLASHYPKLRGVVTLSIPVFLFKEKTIRFFLPLAALVTKKYKKRWFDVKDMNQIKEFGRHLYLPITSIKNFYKFIDTFTKKEAHKVRIPALIMHSRNDHVSQSRSSQWLFEEIKHKDKELCILDKENHHLIYKTRSDLVFEKIANFIAKNRQDFDA